MSAPKYLPWTQPEVAALAVRNAWLLPRDLQAHVRWPVPPLGMGWAGVPFCQCRDTHGLAGRAGTRAGHGGGCAPHDARELRAPLQRRRARHPAGAPLPLLCCCASFCASFRGGAHRMPLTCGGPAADLRRTCGGPADRTASPVQSRDAPLRTPSAPACKQYAALHSTHTPLILSDSTAGALGPACIAACMASRRAVLTSGGGADERGRC